MNTRSAKIIEDRYSALFYYERALPRWALIRRWRAKREWMTWLHALHYVVREEWQRER